MGLCLELDDELWTWVAWVIGWIDDILNKMDQAELSPEFFFPPVRILFGVVVVFGTIATLSLVFGNFESDLVLHDQLSKHNCRNAPRGFETTDGMPPVDDGDVPVGWYVVDVLSMPMDEINCDFHRCLFGELNEDAQRRVLIVTMLVVRARHIRCVKRMCLVRPVKRRCLVEKVVDPLTVAGGMSFNAEKIMSDVVRLMLLMSFAKSSRSGLGASSICVSSLSC